MQNSVLPNLEADLKSYFIATGFIDLFPLAIKLANQLGYGHSDVIEAICKVADKCKKYPPTRNRTAWFTKVFKEKLGESRADSLRICYLQKI